MQSGQRNRSGLNPYQDRATPKPGTKKFGNNKAMCFDWSKLGLSADVVEDLETAARHSLATKTWSSYKTADGWVVMGGPLSAWWPVVAHPNKKKITNIL